MKSSTVAALMGSGLDSLQRSVMHLRQSSLSPTDRRILDDIESVVNALSSNLNGMLATIDGTQVTSAEQRFNLRQLLANAMALTELALAPDTQLAIDYPGGQAEWFYGDGSSIQQFVLAMTHTAAQAGCREIDVQVSIVRTGNEAMLSVAVRSQIHADYQAPNLQWLESFGQAAGAIVDQQVTAHGHGITMTLNLVIASGESVLPDVAGKRGMKLPVAFVNPAHAECLAKQLRPLKIDVVTHSHAKSAIETAAPDSGTEGWIVDADTFAQMARADEEQLRRTPLLVVGHLGTQPTWFPAQDQHWIPSLSLLNIMQWLATLPDPSPVEIDDGQLANTSVLVVDDTPASLVAVRAQLRRLGCHVDCVESGSRAIECLASKDFDVVLMDCRMPIIDGHETTVQIRNGQAAALNRNIPIIGMTACTVQYDRKRSLAVGMSDYLTKPVDLASMEAAVIRWSTHALLETTPRQQPKVTLQLDRAAAIERLGGDHELYDEVLAMFLDEAPQLISQLGEAMASNDHIRARRLAHSLKGAASNIGATEIQEHAGRLESAILTQDDSVATFYQSLRQHGEQLTQRIKA